MLRSLAISFLTVLVASIPVSQAGAGVITIETDAADATAEVGLYGRGLCLNSVEPESDGGPLAFNTAEMAARCSSDGNDFQPIEGVRILLMVPGYRIATHELADATQIWSPQLTKLPRFELRAQIVPPPGEPSRVTVGYWMLEAMSFFEYSDGGVPRLMLGSGSVSDDGSFTLDLPHLLRDPFFSESSRKVEITLQSDVPDGSITFRVGLRELYSGEQLVLDAP